MTTRMALAGIAMALLLFPSGAARAADAATTTAVAQEIEQMEAALTAARRAHDEAALNKLYDDNLLDMHASGWLYDKAQGFALDRNTGKVPGQQKQILARQRDRRVVVFGKDAAAVVWVSETYYETPDPEQEAIQAGVFTQDPAALARAKAAAANGPGAAPGEGPSPNPYRIRTVRSWARIDGQWRVVSSAAAKIGPRVVPGRFE